MVRPFRRKGGKVHPPIKDDDELIGVVGEIDDKAPDGVTIGENSSEVVLKNTELGSGSSDEEIKDDITSLLKKSSQTVIRTCLDIRRADNVLIVCDPTTGEIGQALHEAAI
ncbi:MAG: hypothetical protein GWO84_03195 [Euryarchaeota archaeon]|nr:hypothetical protein [Euryarchaeota archaeon]